MISTVLLLWLFVTLVAVSWTWTAYLARLAAEKTIRQAIDKGLILDLDMIERLRPTPSRRWDVRLIVPGVILAFGGLGVALFAVLLALDSPKALFPVLSLACIPMLTGAGFIVSGLWLRRLGRD